MSAKPAPILNADQYRVGDSLCQILDWFKQSDIGTEGWQEDLASAITILRDQQRTEANRKKLRRKYAEPLAILERGEYVDCSRSNGLVRSSKEIMRQDDDHYTIIHEISDAYSEFSEFGLFEMWEGVRDAWNGDLPDEEFDEPDRDEDGNIINEQ